MADAIKNALLITDDGQNINLGLEFQQDLAKKVYEKMKTWLTNSDFVKDLSNGKVSSCTQTKVRSLVNKQGISQEEFIDLLNKHNIIDGLAEDLLSSLFSTYGWRKSKVPYSTHLINNTVIGYDKINKILKLAKFKDLQFGNIIDIYADGDDKKSDEYKYRYYNGYIVFDSLNDEASEINLNEDRFFNYEFNFKKKKGLIPLNLDYETLKETIQEIYLKYVYEKEALMDTLYINNAFAFNQAKHLIDSGEMDEIIGANVNEMIFHGAWADENNYADDFDPLYKEIFYTDISTAESEGNKIKMTPLVCDQPGDNFLDSMRIISKDLIEYSEIALKYIDALYDTPDFDNHDHVLELAENNWVSVEDLGNKLSDYTKQNN